jgi:hypothetical protein
VTLNTINGVGLHIVFICGVIYCGPHHMNAHGKSHYTYSTKLTIISVGQQYFGLVAKVLGVTC